MKTAPTLDFASKEHYRKGRIGRLLQRWLQRRNNRRNAGGNLQRGIRLEHESGVGLFVQPMPASLAN